MEAKTTLVSAKPLHPGYELNCYTIREVLGTGGFGITYLAFDNNLDREVAIKEYLPDSFAHRHVDDSIKPISVGHDENFTWGLANFLKEAKTLAKFNHDNIVRVHTAFEANNSAYMVMEYERGEDLASIIKTQGSIDQQMQDRIFFPIIEGLNKIHDLGFIHRDIKPANIYLRSNGSPVLIDFGSARQTELQSTSEFTTLISQGYTPLEQYSADYGEQGRWTDLYSMAATIYHCITGAKADDSLSRSACKLRSLPDRVKQLLPQEYPGFRPAYLEAVLAGLSLQPEQRPQTLSSWQKMLQSDETIVYMQQPNDSSPATDPGYSRESLPEYPSARGNRPETAGSERAPQSNRAANTRSGSAKGNYIGLAFGAMFLFAITAGFAYYYLSTESDGVTPVVENKNDSPTAPVATVADVKPIQPAVPVADNIIVESQPAEAASADNASLSVSTEDAVLQVLFNQPLDTDTQSPARSIQQLAQSTPENPPIEGLDEALWKGQDCSNCHDWTRENLCTQGEFYVAKDATAITRTNHPFNGTLKKALRDWADGGCL